MAHAAAELRAVALGVSLGLYDALREAGALAPEELARLTGHDATDLAEWLAQQAEAGVLVADTAAGPAMRRYGLPHGHDEVLAEHDNPACLAAFLERAAAATTLRQAARAARSLHAGAA